jgi:hypothetical protein
MNTICANNEAAQMKSGITRGITNNITSDFCVAMRITLGEKIFQHLYQTKFVHDKMNTISANNEAAQIKSSITHGIRKNITSDFCVAM